MSTKKFFALIVAFLATTAVLATSAPSWGDEPIMTPPGVRLPSAGGATQGQRCCPCPRKNQQRCCRCSNRSYRHHSSRSRSYCPAHCRRGRTVYVRRGKTCPRYRRSCPKQAKCKDPIPALVRKAKALLKKAAGFPDYCKGVAAEAKKQLKAAHAACCASRGSQDDACKAMKAGQAAVLKGKEKECLEKKKEIYARAQRISAKAKKLLRKKTEEETKKNTEKEKELIALEGKLK